MHYTTVKFQDHLFKVLRVFDDSPDFPVEQTQNRLLVCDKVLRKQGKLYFCRSIQDVDIEHESLQLVETGTQKSGSTSADTNQKRQIQTTSED